MGVTFHPLYWGGWKTSVNCSNENGYIDFSGDVNPQVYKLSGIKDQEQKDYIRSILATQADGLDSDESDE